MRSPIVPIAFILLTVAPVFAGETVTSFAWRRFSAQAARTLLEAQRAPATIPPPPAGVAELSFNEFFSPVVGDRGLDLSTKFRALHGQRVRIAGHMTREMVRQPGLFLLTAWPTKIESDGFCFSDDLPPAVLHVLLPAGREGEPPPYVPGLLLLTGTLEVGPLSATQGRNSIARLRLDPPAVAAAAPHAVPARSPGTTPGDPALATTATALR